MHDKPSDTTAAVDAFMATLQHPHKPAVEQLRRIVTSADARIAEGVKWNAPSFRLDDYFATTHLRSKRGVGLVLHRGAKPRQEQGRVAIDDPSGLLTWPAPDRALAEFADSADLLRHEAALVAIVRQWLAAL